MVTADQSFPSDYWVAIATVIPVFFLVIAVQGRTYEEMITVSLKYFRTYMSKGFSFKQVLAMLASAAIMAVAVCLIIMPAASEAMALVSLGAGSDSLNEMNFVMSTTILLLIAVIIPPLTIPIRAIIRLHREWRPAGKSTDISMREREQVPVRQQDNVGDESSESDTRTSGALTEGGATPIDQRPRRDTELQQEVNE